MDVRKYEISSVDQDISPSEQSERMRYPVEHEK